MKRRFALLLLVAMLLVVPTSRSFADNVSTIQLGSEVLFSKFHDMIKGKKVGLVTNQTGVNSWGESTIDLLRQDPEVTLTALYGPEHGIDGQALAGAYVESYMHKQFNIPVYSLYGKTRIPTEEMFKNIDVLLFDMQDIGARSYTYMSTLNYCLVAAKKYNKPVILLDRPNPVGGIIVDGPIAKDPFLSFVGIDNLPMAHGMTAGELALFYNRKIAANLTVIPMEGYARNMVYQDTGLAWIPSSPRIPDLQAVFGYMATGLGEGTGVFQSNFQWIGSKGLDSYKFANLLNQAKLPGVQFIAEPRGIAGGAKLLITDPRTFNPAKTGIYALAYARSLTKFPVPKSGKTIVMFDKIMGTNKIGEYLEKNMTPQQIEAQYAQELAQFKQLRKQFLIYHEQPYQAMTPIFNNPLITPVVTPTAAKPVAAKPVVAKPVVAKPVVAKPVAAKPVVAKPVAAQPHVAMPVAIKPTAPKIVAYTFPYGITSATSLVDKRIN